MVDNKIKILLVEDNPGDVRLIEEMIKEAGASQFNLSVEGTLEGALGCLRKESFEGVMLDLNLPDSQGLATLKNIQENFSRIAIIVVTGLNDESIAIESQRRGAEDFLVKGRFDSFLLVRSLKYAIERKRAQGELKESELRYRSLFESTKDGILILDFHTGEIIDINPFLIDLLGYSKDNFLNKYLWEIGAFKDIILSKDNFLVLQNKDYIRYEDLPLETKDGKKIDVEFVSNIYAVEGTKTIQCNIRDVTERKQMAHKLYEAYQKINVHTKDLEMINDNLDSFAYSVSHDLRAPLRAISGFAQVLLDTQGDKVNEEMRHYLDRISEGAQKMGRLIDDLLGFSRATRGDIKYEKINVEDIVNDLVKAYRNVELDRDIEFIVNPLGEVEADKEMLKVVFSNLLQNAVKFTIDRKKACIEIGSEQKEDDIQFYVKDNGIGFNMKYKDKLFKAFQRLHTDERFTGTGIGLSTVQRIVTKHGGNIWAKGEVDKGAEFCFTLPSKAHIDV